MSEKKSGQGSKSWFWRNDKGAKSGPVDLAGMKALVASGGVEAQTQVSVDGEQWSLAAAHAELGFDCIVLETGKTLNVLGPFPNATLGRKDVMQNISGDGFLFTRGGTVSEGVRGFAAGSTGAAMAERVQTAEKGMRDSEKARRAAEASLAAKDLEFDAERQKLNGVVSGLKAAELKLKAEVEELRAELESSKGGGDMQLRLEAKLVDAENLVSEMRASALKVQAEADDGRKQAQDLQSEIAAAKDEADGLRVRIQEGEAKYAELERRLSDTGKQLTERDAKCVGLEGALAEAKAAAGELEMKVAEQSARIEELVRSAESASVNVREFSESAKWLRGRLTDLAGEVAEKFYVAEMPQSTYSNVDKGVEVVDAEIVDDAPASGSAPLSKGAAPVVSRVSVIQRADAPAGGSSGMEKISALENQLKRELSSLSAAKAATAAPTAAKGSVGREGIIGVFKRKK